MRYYSAITFLALGIFTLAVALLSHTLEMRPTGMEEVPLLVKSIALFACAIAWSVLPKRE